MKIEKYIKTECGRNRYYELKRNYDKSIFSKIQLFVYVIIAETRDIFR